VIAYDSEYSSKLVKVTCEMPIIDESNE